MSGAGHDEGFLPLHRSEALTDGIFAVAMTLLVIELKLPDNGALRSADELAGALGALIPKAISWALSFFVLALFWIGHHRAFAHVRSTDGRLVVLNLLQLACVSLMPFSSALSGEYGRALLSQVVFSINMALLGVTALLVLRYIHAHPELGPKPMSTAKYRSGPPSRRRRHRHQHRRTGDRRLGAGACVRQHRLHADGGDQPAVAGDRAARARQCPAGRGRGAFAVTSVRRARLNATKRPRTPAGASAAHRPSRPLRRR